MASTCETITCSDACDDNLPAVDFTICAPEVNSGEIDAIFLTNIGNSLTDENSLVEWTGRLAATDDTKIIELHVIGDKPAATENEIVISRNTIVSGNKDHVINIEIQQTNHTNYEFMRSMECGRKVLGWYRTSGGKLYGGKDGIEMTVRLNHIIPKSNKEITIFAGTAKWSAKFHPCETDSVI